MRAARDLRKYDEGSELELLMKTIRKQEVEIEEVELRGQRALIARAEAAQLHREFDRSQSTKTSLISRLEEGEEPLVQRRSEKKVVDTSAAQPLVKLSLSQFTCQPPVPSFTSGGTKDIWAIPEKLRR